MPGLLAIFRVEIQDNYVSGPRRLLDQGMYGASREPGKGNLSHIYICHKFDISVLLMYTIHLKFISSLSHKFHMELQLLKSMAGYASLPTVDDALSYMLPPFQLASRRIVQIGQRFWELWSPNSARVEFYPGTAISGFPLEHQLPQLRRADGHQGRFDPTINPQVLDHARLWYPFVRTEAPAAEYPEFSNFADVWDDRFVSFHASFLRHLSARMDTLAAGMELRTDFEQVYPDLWAARPRYSLKEDVEALNDISSYYEALDRYSQVQRDAKLAAAWIKMVHALLTFPPANAASMARVKPAKPGMMGSWINGSTKEDGWWLLSLGIPCYIIHERDTYWDYRVMGSSARVYSFLAGTRTDDRLLLAAGADAAIRVHGYNLVDAEDDYGRASTVLTSSFQDRVRSSTRGQGWLFGKYIGPPTPFPELTEKMGYIVPPRVAAVGSGRWEHWVEDVSDEGYRFMVWQGRKKERSGKTYYDRALRRILHFDHDVHPLRHYVADSDVFGLPVPDYLFYLPLQNNQPVERARSQWMYRSKEPMRADVGREYVASFADPGAHYNPTDTKDEDSEDEGSEFLMEPPYSPAFTGHQNNYTRSSVSPPRPRSPSLMQDREEYALHRNTSRFEGRNQRSPSYDRRHPGSRSRNRSATRRRSRSRSRDAHSKYQRFRRERSPPRHWLPPPSVRSRSRSPTRRRFAAPDRYRPLQNRYSRQRRRSSSPSAGPSRFGPLRS